MKLALEFAEAFSPKAFRAAGIALRIMSKSLGYSAAGIAAIKPEDATMMELGFQLVDDEPKV